MTCVCNEIASIVLQCSFYQLQFYGLYPTCSAVGWTLHSLSGRPVDMISLNTNELVSKKQFSVANMVELVSYTVQKKLFDARRHHIKTFFQMETPGRVCWQLNSERDLCKVISHAYAACSYKTKINNSISGFWEKHFHREALEKCNWGSNVETRSNQNSWSMLQDTQLYLVAYYN